MKWAVMVLLLCLRFSSASADVKMPFMSGEAWTCTQGNNAPSDPTKYDHWASLGMAYAWDFAKSGDSDIGEPVLAPVDGTIAEVVYECGSCATGWGKYVIIRQDGGGYVRLCHFSNVFVRLNEHVYQGQVIATLGTTGHSSGYHTHVQWQSTIHGSSIPASFSDVPGNGIPVEDGSYTSGNAGVFDREFTAMGGSNNYGSVTANIGWSNGYNYADYQYSDGRAKTAYWKRYQSSTGWYRSGIVYDGLGGARKAYTIRTGFWEETVDAGGGDGWSENNGPQSALGMPITNEYTTSYGSRQDFQKGYLKFQSGDVTIQTSGYTAPGWVSSGFWDKTFSYLMAMAYDRNGRDVSVGHASGNAVSQSFSALGVTSSYYSQSFTGGTNGSGMIFYHPDNAVKNAQATNEAYYLYGNFLDKWNQLGGANVCGVPTRDWYMSRDPQNWDNATEYKLQNFMRANGEQHYMILKNGTVEWHSSYKMQLVSISPSGTVSMRPGATKTFTVTVKNTGTVGWSNDPVNQPDDYMTLLSTDPSGNTATSFLNSPYSSGLGWISSTTVGTMQQSVVNPNQTAAFTFQGKVADTAVPGVVNVYFRPNHATGGPIDGWESLTIPIKVLPQYFGLVLRNPSTAQWWARVSNGTSFAFPTGPNTPADLWISGWAQDGGSGYTFTPFAGDLNGDGYDDLIVERSDCNWYWAWNNKNGSFTSQGQAILTSWGTGGYPGKYFFWFAEMNGDRKDELLTYDASNANWYVCFFNTTTGTYDNCSLWTSWGGGVGTFQPLIGDWNGDGKTDICLRNWSTGAHWVRLSTGSGFTQPSPDNWIVWGADTSPSTFIPVAGDWNADGKDDLMLWKTTTAEWYVRTSNGSAFVYPSGSNNPADRWMVWGDPSYTLFSGDFNDDGKADIGLKNTSTGDHWVRLSTGLAFSQPSPDNWSGWGAGSSFQLLAGRFGNGSLWSSFSAQPVSPGDDRQPQSAPLSFRMWLAPNPITSGGSINFTLRTSDRIRISVYDVRGREVSSIPEREYGPGQHSVSWNQNRQAGIYFVQLTSKLHTATAKIVVVN